MLTNLPVAEKTATSPSKKMRIAIIGCGAVAQQFHLPVLAGHEGVRIAALVDRDKARASHVAGQYGITAVYSDENQLSPDKVDGVIIATPPSSHASLGIDLLRRGMHVFVEKPMALNLADAEKLVQAAEESGKTLAVGVFRRLLPCMRLLKATLDKELFGKASYFEVGEGSIYGWAAATLGNMRKELAGGGILMDMGPHTFDRLLYLFPGHAEVLDYRDNSLGGIESDCSMRLCLEHKGQPIKGQVELSRTRKLHNKIRVKCERGVLELRPGDRYRVWVIPDEAELYDTWPMRSRPYVLQASWEDEPDDASWYEPFRAEIDDWLDAIHNKREPQLSGKSVLPSVKLIDECYQATKPMDEPWVQEGLRSEPKPALNGTASATLKPSVFSAPTITVKDTFSPPQRILLTGATGFIGCRVAEILRLREGWEVRALVHKPSSAARLARLPVEMVQGDLQSNEDVARAVAGCDVVVHCAIGTEYGQPKKIRAVTVGGTRNLAAAAREAGVRRFVHISSIAVLGNDGRNILDEDTPVRPQRGDGYGQSKADAERAVLKEAQRGLSAVILRPGCVYGPFGQTFISRPLQAMMEDRLVLQGCAEQASNTIYVDNVAQAIVCAIKAPASVANGQAFILSDGDELTWGDFYGYFAKELGGRVIEEPAGEKPGTSSKGLLPIQWLRTWLTGTRDILTSAEIKGLAKKVLQTDPYGYLPRLLLEKSPGLEQWLRRKMGGEGAVIYTRPGPATGPMIRFTAHSGSIQTTHAERTLGYQPSVPRAQALELTLKWVRQAGVIGE